MPDSPAPNVVDGVAEPTPVQTHWAVPDAHAAWFELAYHRFLVSELGGKARPFEDMPGRTLATVQKRNEILHAQDLDLSPELRLQRIR